MRGKWAQGIKPRRFTWIIKDRVAMCERPGGCGENHRRVRRQEEIIWIRQNEFAYVVSLIPSTHNLHNYEEMGVPFHHVPFLGPKGGPLDLTRAMSAIRDHVAAGEKIVVHREEVGELVMGLIAAYLLWTGLVERGPQAINVAEHLFEAELGPTARQLVTMVAECDPSDAVPAGAFINCDDPESECSDTTNAEPAVDEAVVDESAIEQT